MKQVYLICILYLFIIKFLIFSVFYVYFKYLINIFLTANVEGMFTTHCVM